MDFNELSGKAQELAKDHPEEVEGAADKAGEFGKERFAGHDEQIDEGVEKIDGWVPGGKGGDAAGGPA
ncbi:MAG: antitoxin [Pseudonocardiales bacterium]|nr:antitoxin [Pseudonocardiales bacterium]